MDIQQRIDKVFSCKGWFPPEEMLWAIINDDKDAIATYRLRRKKLDEQKAALFERIEQAATEKEKEAILAEVKAPMDAKIVSDDELTNEKARMAGSI